MTWKILLLVLDVILLAAAMYLSYRSGIAKQKAAHYRAWVDALAALERRIEERRCTAETLEDAQALSNFITGAEWFIEELQEREEKDDE